LVLYGFIDWMSGVSKQEAYLTSEGNSLVVLGTSISGNGYGVPIVPKNLEDCGEKMKISYPNLPVFHS
jgi:hypothetical protein